MTLLDFQNSWDSKTRCVPKLTPQVFYGLDPLGWHMSPCSICVWSHLHWLHYRVMHCKGWISLMFWFGRHFPLEGVTRKSMQSSVEWTPKHMRCPSLKLRHLNVQETIQSEMGIVENMFPSTLVSRPNLEFRIYHFGSLLQQDCKERSVTLNMCFPIHRLTPDWDLTPFKKKGPNGCDTINGGSCHSALTMSWLHDPTACHSGFLCLPHVCLAFLPLLNDFGGHVFVFLTSSYSV